MAQSTFPESEARRVIRQLLHALAHCHNLGIVHRDLKPENLLFDGPGPAGRLKVIDFGYTALVPPGAMLSGLSGTPDYVAPEVRPVARPQDRVWRRRAWI